MKVTRSVPLVCLLLALAASPILADVWVEAFPGGSNISGNGTEINPYANIFYAYSQITTQGETIRAKPGDYFEVVNAFGRIIQVGPNEFEELWVNIVADNPSPGATKIIGNFVNSTVILGGLGSSIRGFTIQGGGLSTVLGLGSVTIEDNIISGNSGDTGGGIRIESRTCAYGAETIAVVGNTVTNNHADVDGGGIMMRLGVDDVGCQSADVNVLIEDNIITGNDADDDGGGMLVVTDTFPNFLAATVIVRGNVVSGNTALDDGGGARFRALGEGHEAFIISGNTFNQNVALDDGGGLVGELFASQLAGHTMFVERNQVTNNTAADEGGGMLLSLEPTNLASNQSYSMIVSQNLISNNTANSLIEGGGGIHAQYDSIQSTILAADLAEFRIESNVISFNDAQAPGGGLALFVDANHVAGACLVTGFPATARIDVENNLIYRNDSITGSGGGAYVRAQSCLNSTASAVFTLDTIALNQRSIGAGGIEVEFFTDQLGATELMVSHSILYNNDGSGIGGPTPTADFVVDVEYSDVDGHSPDYATWIGNRTGLLGNISLNPQFVSVAGNNYHLQSSSPAIEAGSRLLGEAPPVDALGGPRAVDSNSDGLYVVDMGAAEFFVCADADLDGFGSPISGGDHCTLDNCPSDYNPGQSDCDVDTVGDVCDPDTIDADADGVDVLCDVDDGDPFVCADLDGDLCDDCLSGVAYPADDGADFDLDGLCNLGDPDDDSDGAPDIIDALPLNPFACGDADGDTCGDDCTSGFFEPFNDGPDFDADGLCDAGDPDDDNDGVPDGQDTDPFNPNVCGDSDLDTCEDCTSGVSDPANDGTDEDADGRCAAGDSDDTDASACADEDGDTCDDCSVGPYDPLNDGPDFDLDGLCDLGDPDDDNDTVPDAADCAPFTTGVNAPAGALAASLRLGPEKERLSWLNVPSAHVYNVYRGLLGAGNPLSYNHTCHVGEVPALETIVATGIQSSGDLFYYLVTGKNTCGEGPAGRDSAGATIPTLDPCPLQSNDTDQDGVLDTDDNCVGTINPDQTDADGDTVGNACDNCLTTSNVQQLDFDDDTIGDACDFCTDLDGDGLGDPGFPGDTCPEDNCPSIPNPGQFDGDGDGLGNPCDPCPNDALNDHDNDEICGGADNCPETFNPSQIDSDSDGDGDPCDTCTDLEGDGAGEPGFPANTCPPDNCPNLFNPFQANNDGDGLGDACDTCTDSDGDALGDPGFPLNLCPDDNCPSVNNPTQIDTDGDGEGDSCDPCDQNPDAGCVACPGGTDPDEDGACQPNTVLVAENFAMRYLANPADPLIGLDWVAENFVPPPSWQNGVYGVGYDTTGEASDLIKTAVPDFSLSIYTRATFALANPGVALGVELGVDYDDGYVAWLNGVEIFRSAEMPAGDPNGETAATSHEPSNAADPVFEPFNDITVAAQGALHPGNNVLAIGVWNQEPTSSDLVLVPNLRILTLLDNCPDLSNPDQLDTDGDGLGDACDLCTDSDDDGVGDPGFPLDTCPGDDNCPNDANPGQEDGDEDGAGDACDVCPTDPTDDDVDADGVCTVDDNCPNDPNPSQADSDVDLIGDACDICPTDPTNPDEDLDGICTLDDNCPNDFNPSQADQDADTVGDVCDVCPSDPTDDDVDLDGVCTVEDNCPTDPNPLQEDADADLVGDICDTCTDIDADGFGSPGFPLNTCPEDNCPTDSNPSQQDSDVDGLGDVCDPCAGNPDPGCVECPNPVITDPDGDGACDQELVLVQEGSSIDYLPNSTDPLIGLDWIEENYVLGPGWLVGDFGIGYDTGGQALDLISTTLPALTRSAYARVSMNVTTADLAAALRIRVGADFDDAYVFWINGVEIFRSANVPAGDPAWNQTLTFQHEPSNAADPVYEPLTDVTTEALLALHDGTNVAAIGLWNVSSTSSDMLLVPLLSITTGTDNCPLDPNPGQLDSDGDGFGDVCDPDDDNDGVDDVDDSDPFDPFVCRDADADTCEDCLSGTDDPANDGPDGDGDGLCDAGDSDLDNDGVDDVDDNAPLDPFVCRDADSDTCDDCSSGTDDPANDGPDSDGDGLCDDGDPDDDGDGDPDVSDCAPFDPLIFTGQIELGCNGIDENCNGPADDTTVDADSDTVTCPTDPDDGDGTVCGLDADLDTCDDCTAGAGPNPANDGTDTDSDGQCDASDPDDDGDGVADGNDADPLNPFVCRDADADACDDCTSGTSDPANDGPDPDIDGICDATDNCPVDFNPLQTDSDNDGPGDACDPDDDNDGDPDGTDCAPLDPLIFTGQTELGCNGIDENCNGLADDTTVDADADTVGCGTDPNDADPTVCGLDADLDTCDDCSAGAGPDPANDGTDTDGNGICDPGDPDDDGDGDPDGTDCAPLDPLIFAGQTELGCNGIDENCNGPADDTTVDADSDLVACATDPDDQNPLVCGDIDADTCDDCTAGAGQDPANDGPDADSDGVCDAGDNDTDNDGIDDADDSDPFDPFVCRDFDTDGCDDCSSGTSDVANDGPDQDGDGQCDVGDLDIDGDQVPNVEDNDPLDPFVCRDVDTDLCDDCTSGTDNRLDDGLDTDGEGYCDLGDPDDDNDGVADGEDSAPFDPSLCQDLDADTCDDCSIGTDGFGLANDFDPANDGPDQDGDGQCDAGDPDVDGDGVADGSDSAPFDPFVCRDLDADTCDDCSSGTDDPANDGTDTDSDGQCDAGDPDNDGDGDPDVTDCAPLDPLIFNGQTELGCNLIDENCNGPADDTTVDADADLVVCATDPDDQNPLVCGDIDADTCDDCTAGAGQAPANDGTDTDSDGLCDAGDPDDDGDGVADGSDSAPLDPFVCRDVDADTCDDCSSGTDDPANDGPDNDGDGLCDAGDPTP